MMSATGRFAPSPSGDLHIGNLRTAVLAWLWARQSGRRFVIRVEDIDRVQPGAAERQLRDLAALGITWDEPPLFQSTRHAAHLAAIETLREGGYLFECYCSRRDIAAASAAPHTRPGFYPGTCRDLTESQRREHRERLASLGRRPALRLNPDVDSFSVDDVLAGTVTEPIDAVVLQRGDGTIAYNLVVVVDDEAQGVDQVVRGDDLLFTAPTQAYIGSLLGFAAPPTYVHVPLVLSESGARLAKRDGAVTLTQLGDAGWSSEDVIEAIAGSLGVQARSLEVLGERLDLDAIPRDPWVFHPPTL